MYLVTAAEMRNFDRIATEEYGIPGIVLMENAGRSTFEILLSRLGCDIADLRVAVLAGPGNNGGDGYVIARYLMNRGADVSVYLLSPREKIKGDALSNLIILENMCARIFTIKDEEELKDAIDEWHACEVIIDALLGTGLSSEVRSPYKEAITAVNKIPALKLAVDLPSGIDADSGQVLGCAIIADITVTYGMRKIGTAVYPGIELCGDVELVDISIPINAVVTNPPRAIFYNNPDLSCLCNSRRDPTAHKGTFGHLLVVGGSTGKSGAPAMTAISATKMGAGLVTVAAPASLNDLLEIKLTEEMTEPLPELLPGTLGEESIERILELAEGKRCLVLGPGLSTGHGISEMVEEIVSNFRGTLLIDADGLNALGSRPECLKNRQYTTVLTPHPGEMGRLAGIPTSEVQENRIQVAVEFAEEFGCWIVLKGAGTITAAPNGHFFINSTGNSWMASGGQGDVLSGILGGLLVQNIPPEEAIPLGVYLHGKAADDVVANRGAAPVSAGDVIGNLSCLIGELTKHANGEED